MALIEGYLTKSPPKSMEDFIQIKRWKLRYFELKKVNEKFILEYRKSKASKTLKGSIDLSHVEYLVNNFPFIRERRNLFALKINDNTKIRIFYFNAKSINEFNDWIKNLISLLNLTPSHMNIDRAKELILAGFFAKSSIKNEKEYCDLFVNSLTIFTPQKIIDAITVHKHQCRKYYEHENRHSESFLPTRCTSTLSTDSSSEEGSSDETVNSEIKNEIPLSINDRYIDSNKLEFKPVLMKPKLNNLPTTDAVIYCEIDIAHTEGLYKLNKRLDSI